MFYLQCPDPHFKKRHHKRRVVQKTLVDSIVNHLMPGGKVSALQRFFFAWTLFFYLSFQLFDKKLFLGNE